MILARASRKSWVGVFVVAVAFSASAAQADVMQLDAEGARWVAGGTPSANDTQSSAQPLSAQMGGPRRVGAPLPDVPTNAVVVPHNAIADPRTHAAGVPPRYAAKITELSRRFDLSPSLLEALVWQESRWRENAVSPAGARGLAQLMPATARYLGVNPNDPMQNLEGGARYLREQLDTFDGDLEKALAAYNAGPGRVIKAGGIPNIRETRQYVAAIMGRLAAHSRPANR